MMLGSSPTRHTQPIALRTPPIGTKKATRNGRQFLTLKKKKLQKLNLRRTRQRQRKIWTAGARAKKPANGMKSGT